MRNTRVKVKRELLIEKMGERLAKRQEKFDTEMAAYETAIANEAASVASEVAAIAADFKKDPVKALIEHTGQERYSGRSVFLPLKTRVSVEKPDEWHIKNLKKQIRVLESASDDTISVSTHDEYYDYL